MVKPLSKRTHVVRHAFWSRTKNGDAAAEPEATAREAGPPAEHSDTGGVQQAFVSGIYSTLKGAAWGVDKLGKVVSEQAATTKVTMEKADALRKERQRLAAEAATADPVSDRAFMAMLQGADPRVRSSDSWAEVSERFGGQEAFAGTPEGRRTVLFRAFHEALVEWEQEQAVLAAQADFLGQLEGLAGFSRVTMQTPYTAARRQINASAIKKVIPEKELEQLFYDYRNGLRAADVEVRRDLKQLSVDGIVATFEEGGDGSTTFSF